MKFILLALVYMHSAGFAAGSKPIDLKPGKLNYAAFSGDYVLVKATGKVAHWCTEDLREIRVVANAAQKRVYLAGCEDKLQLCNFNSINSGRDEFDSCFSDGMKGYTESVGNGNTVVFRTIHIKAGFLCTGKKEACRSGHYLIAEGNGKLTLGIASNCSSRNSAICEYEKR